MKKRSIKRVAGAAAGAAVAVSTLAALTPAPAGAAGGTLTTIAVTGSTFTVALTAANVNGAPTGPKLHIHDLTDPSVVAIDSDSPIRAYYAPGCAMVSSGDGAHRFRAQCSGVPVGTVITVQGSQGPDAVSLETAGHSTSVHGYDGDDTLHGSSAQHDELHGDKGADTLFVEDGDIAGCGLNDAGTAVDGQHDTVFYNGTPTFKNCNISGNGVRDTETFSSKA